MHILDRIPSPRILTALAALIVFLIPWQARWVLRAGEWHGAFWEYGTIGVYAIDIPLLLFLILAFIAWWRTPGQERRIIPGFSFLFLFVGWACVSFGWSVHHATALFPLFQLLKGVAFFFALRILPVNHRIVTSAFIASAALQSILTLIQFGMQAVVPWEWSGMAPHLPATLGTAVVETAAGRWLRAYGSFPHPNLLGAFLAVAFLLCLDAVIEQSRRFAVLPFFLITLGLLISFSRAAWIGAALGAITLLIIRRPRDRQTLTTLGIVLLAFFAVAAAFSPLILPRVTAHGRLEDRSMTDRTAQYQGAWAVFAHHPLFGVGIGQYTKVAYSGWDPAWSAQPVHNVFALVLTELGIIGLALFLAFLFFLVRATPLSAAPFFICLLPLLLFDHSLWTLGSGVLLFWSALAFSYHE